MIKISGEFDDNDDSDNATESGDSDLNEVDPENDSEISNDNDQDYNSDKVTESGDKFNPFKCPDYNKRDPDYNRFKFPDYNKRDPDYNRFKFPDYGNKEEIEDQGVERHTGEEQNEFPENLSGKEENIEEITEENSEPETNQQEERVEDSDSEIHEPKPEITSSVETENIGTEKSTITLQQQSQEQIPEHDPEDNEDNIELIDAEGNPSKSVESSEVLTIRKELEEMNLPPELENEPLNEHMLESVPEQDPDEKPDDTKPIDSEGEPLKPIQNEDEEINKIILDTEKMEWKKMEFLGEHQSSHEEMEVEMLEEEMEDLFNKYAEKELEQLETSYELNQENHQEHQELEEELEEAYTQEQEFETSYELNQENHQEKQELEERLEEGYTQEQGLETSHESNQENHQEKQELEERLEEAFTKEQEEKVNLEIERAQEQDEKEDIKESLHTKIKENMQELSQEIKQSNRKSQEIEQEITQKVLQNIVQKDIQEQVENQKELTLKKSTKFFKERYREETGRRPIYAGKETRGFIEWKDHLKEQREKQEEKDYLFREKKKEFKEHSKEIRESKEEWAQYLENSIREAEFPEDIKTKLNEILEKYEQLRELLKNLKNKEISEEAFKKEVKEFEDLLIEKRYITRPLFMNFDWFRRYYNGRIKKGGKMVAHLYISNKTREFLSYISRRIELLNSIGNLHENTEKFKEFLGRSFQIKERWALLLNRIIRETPNEEISTEVKDELEVVIKTYCEIRAILFNKNILEKDKEKLIQERFEKYGPRFFELFEILTRFLGIYGYYSRNWMDQSLILEGKKTIMQLSQKIKLIKEGAVQEILNGDNSMLQKFKEIIRKNLYKSTELKMNEKSKLLKIIQKKDMSEEDREVIRSLLGRLSKRELKTLLQNDFKNYFLPYNFTVKNSDNPLSRINDRYFKTDQVGQIELKVPSLVQKQNEYIKYKQPEHKSFKIKHKIMLEISGRIYQNLLRRKQPDELLGIINEIYNLIIKEVDMNNRTKEYREYFSNYVLDLIKIIVKLKIINNHNIKEIFEIFPFSKNLKNDGIDLCGHSLDNIAEIVSEIFDHFKETFQDFKIERKGFQNISDIEQRQVRFFKNKFKLITDTFDFNINGKKVTVKFNGKCMNPECPSCADFKILPAIEFHHYKKLSKEKYINLRDASKMNYNKGKFQLESQEGGGEILCKNCHKAETSKFYKYFKEFINRDNIFYDIEGEKRSAEEIIFLILKTINRHLITNEGKENSRKINRYKTIAIQKLKKWVKRKAVIEQLYGKDYICPCCGKISTKNNLESFEIHHANKTLFNKYIKKTNFKKAFETLNVNELIEKIINEECICICANCHSIEKTKHFKSNVERIIGESYVKDVKEIHKKLCEGIENSHKKIIQIKNLHKKKMLKIYDPLKSMIDKYNEIWKKYLVEIFLIINDTNQTFTSLDINKALNYFKNWFNEIKHKLSKRGLISIDTTKNDSNNNYYKYRLTAKGTELARTIIKNWRANHTKEYTKFMNNFRNRVKT